MVGVGAGPTGAFSVNRGDRTDTVRTGDVAGAVVSMSFLVHFFYRGSTPRFLATRRVRFRRLVLDLMRPLLFCVVFRGVCGTFRSFCGIFPTGYDSRSEFGCGGSGGGGLGAYVFWGTRTGGVVNELGG